MDSIIETIREEFRENADEKTRKSGERFFKEEVRLYGLKAAFIRQVSKKYFMQVKEKSKEEIFVICETFWKSGFIEDGFIACDWSYRLHKQFAQEDFEIFEKWLARYVTNWASCDTFCNHTVGEFVEMYPEYLGRLKVWARSENRWMRRGAAVSLIIPARKGKFLGDIFHIADILLLDRDDMVQKGYGWMLKAAGEAYEKEVFNYVMQHKANMPRTSLRYAIEKMPKALKAKAMEK
jgi:3-methyladenine DNA glycosylase AlkD